MKTAAQTVVRVKVGGQVLPARLDQVVLLAFYLGRIAAARKQGGAS